MMKSFAYKPLLILLAVLLLSTVGFLWLDFDVARSTTSAEHSANTYRSGDQLPGSMETTLDYAISGSGPMARSLQGALNDALRASGEFGQTEMWADSVEQTDGPYLLVEIDSQEVTWTPFYATSHLTIHTYFSSNGDISFRNESSVRMDSREAPVVKADGEFDLRDTTWGVFSRPAYYRLLAEYMATQISQSLNSVYKPK
ncbi:MAG: hypothetical protein P8X95_09790 [Anaerolineales bacterium]|jgi:hypothetical protein